FAFGGGKVQEKLLRVSIFEIMTRIFLLRLQKYIGVADPFFTLAPVEIELHDGVDALQIAGEPFEPIGELAGHRHAFYARNLLEISELRDLHAVAPALPAKSPGAESRTLP